MNHFQSSWFKVKTHWHYACNYKMHYSMLYLAPNIHMSGPYKCSVGWTCWASVGNTAMKTYLEKDSVATTVNNGVDLSFYLWLLSFDYSRTLTYFFREAFFETDFTILDHEESAVWLYVFWNLWKYWSLWRSS